VPLRFRQRLHGERDDYEPSLHIEDTRPAHEIPVTPEPLERPGREHGVEMADQRDGAERGRRRGA